MPGAEGYPDDIHALANRRREEQMAGWVTVWEWVGPGSVAGGTRAVRRGGQRRAWPPDVGPPALPAVGP